MGFELIGRPMVEWNSWTGWLEDDDEVDSEVRTEHSRCRTRPHRDWHKVERILSVE